MNQVLTSQVVGEIEKGKKLKPIVLIFIEWFTPGYKAGGPTRAIQNFVDIFSTNMQLFIVTGDRDLADTSPYENIQLNEWIKTGSTSVIYLAPGQQRKKTYIELIKQVSPDVIYLNSLYAYRFTLLPLLAARSIGFHNKIVLAPRGMLKSSALKFKRVKKFLFLSLVRQIGLFRNIWFQATDSQEVNDIQNKLKIKPNCISLVIDPPHIVETTHPIDKKPNSLKLVMVGRVHPIKGLDYLIKVLYSVRSKVLLQVLGMIEDRKYFIECENLIKSLPSNINVEVRGELPFSNILEHLKHNHFMILPTHGENYGHSIFEALSAGRPVIISDQTPWRNLAENRIGWEIPLQQSEKFIEAIETAAAMDQQQFDEYSANARQFALSFLKESKLIESYIDLFTVKSSKP